VHVPPPEGDAHDLEQEPAHEAPSPLAEPAPHAQRQERRREDRRPAVPHVKADRVQQHAAERKFLKQRRDENDSEPLRDPRERIRFRNLLEELSRERVVIFSTHIIEDISSSCSRLAVLNRGHLSYLGEPLGKAVDQPAQPVPIPRLESERQRLLGHRAADQGPAVGEGHADAVDLGLGDRVEFVPPVDRREAHQQQLDADALLLVTAPGQRSVATLKLFDYNGAGVPILALADGNAAAEIVLRFHLGLTAPPDDPRAIAAGLREMMDRVRSGNCWPGFVEAQARFERRTLTGELAALFDRILEER
jgi:glycosyltransferase involved in cell wall biosynthesis